MVRVRVLMTASLFILLAIAGRLSAIAAELDEDHVQVCPVISPELARKAADEVKGHGSCSGVCRGCGCKGGPGYRGPRGCVGWADLIRVCGPPPHANCTRECAIVRPGCRGRAWLKSFAAELGLGSGLAFVPAQNTQVQPAGDTVSPVDSIPRKAGADLQPSANTPAPAE